MVLVLHRLPNIKGQVLGRTAIDALAAKHSCQPSTFAQCPISLASTHSGIPHYGHAEHKARVLVTDHCTLPCSRKYCCVRQAHLHQRQSKVSAHDFGRAFTCHQVSAVKLKKFHLLIHQERCHKRHVAPWTRAPSQAQHQHRCCATANYDDDRKSTGLA